MRISREPVGTCGILACTRETRIEFRIVVQCSTVFNLEAFSRLLHCLCLYKYDFH